MPTVFKEAGYRFLFYSNEGYPREPVRVHVRHGREEAKLWLRPFVSAERSSGLGAAELRRITRIATLRRNEIEAAWHEHFGA